MGQLKYKGYIGSVEYSEEDKCLFGKVQGLHGTLISYEGNSVDDIKADFEQSIDDYLISCKERGISPAKPFSGRLVLRMPSELHEKITNLAATTGTTLNEFINRAINHEIEHSFG